MRLEQVHALAALRAAAPDALRDLVQLLANAADVARAAVCLIDARHVVCIAANDGELPEFARGGTIFDRLLDDDGATVDGDGAGFERCIALRGEGHVVGALWLRDVREHAPDARQLESIALVARRVEELFRRHRSDREQRQLRARLDDSTERLDLVTSVLCDGIWDADITAGSVLLTERCFELLGLPNAIGRVPLAGLLPAVHEQDRRRLLRAAMVHLRRGAAFDVEFRCRHVSGAWRWFRARAVARPSTDGGERLLGSLTDVHEQRRSQERLRRISRLLEESQALARVGGWEFDLTTQHLFWTSETYRIHEVSPADYTPTVDTAIEFYAPEARDTIRAAVEDAIARGRAYSIDLPVVTARGRRIWCRSTGAAVFSGGKVVRLLGAFQDITAQRRLDAEMLAAKEAAESASDAKSAFLAAMSHEIRTPMHTVLGYADMLRDTDLSDEQRECVEVITSSGTSLLRLIDDILDFSKAEAGKMQLERAPVDVHAAVVRVARMLQPQAGQKQLTLTVEPAAPSDCQALGDTQRVHQVLVNLAGNAVKFTQSGGVELRVECRESDVRVAIADTGIGIPKDQIERLFDDFVQVDASTQRRFGGTGLGLAISKQLVEAMGGEVGVDSTPGVGSTFWFTLPKADERCGVEPAPEVRPEPAPVVTAHAGPRRVLLAEDNRLNQRLAVRVLETFGYQVDTANDGAAALELARSGSYDLVLMDCLMPGMDGFEATRQIRAEEAGTGRHLPIIALTANAMPEDRNACLAAGMDDFVSKPFTRVALRQATERWLTQGLGE